MTTSLVMSFAPPCLVAVAVYLGGIRERPDLVQLGWLVGLAAQLVSGTYGVVTQDWGWLLAPLLVGPFFARNWLRGRRPPRPSVPTVLGQPVPDAVDLGNGLVAVPWTEWRRLTDRCGVDPRTGEPV